MDRPFFRHAEQIGFRDTDASGWTHFASVLAYVENAEHACLRGLGLTVHSAEEGGWPRVHVSCDYHQPLRAGEGIDICLGIVALGTSSVTWRFEVLDTAGRPAASGAMVTVRVGPEGRARPLSAKERAALQAGLAAAE